MAEEVQFLRTAGAYGASAKRIETVETHMSWVFIADDTVYKLKKPVRYSFLDFSTVAAREKFCRAEVQLNGRLAPGVYLGVVPLWRFGKGRFALGDAPASGTIVDWLVKMRRLPRERMLDQLLALNLVETAQIDFVGDLLIRFYRTTQACRIGSGAYAERFVEQQLVNRQILMDPAFELDRVQTGRTLERLDSALQLHRALLQARAEDGRVVDGHGDFRPEHVCLLDPPVIIDCLEFNDELRCVDPFDELAYFGLECKIAGAPWIGPRMAERYAAAASDRPPAKLVALYSACRALLRARLCLAHLLEPTVRAPELWVPRARRYLEEATAALAEL